MNSTEPIRCLSIRQPWAWAICVGEKTVENRGWTTKHRGRIAIHAGANPENLQELKNALSQQPPSGMFALGYIIGTVNLVDIVEYHDRIGCMWAGGPQCWMLEDPILFEDPIPTRGRQSLYRLPEEISDQVAAAKPRPSDAQTREWIKTLRVCEFGEEEPQQPPTAYTEDLGLSPKAAPVDALDWSYANAGLDGTSKNDALKLAKSLLKSGDYLAAATAASQAIFMDSTWKEAYALRITAYEKSGNHSAAQYDRQTLEMLESD